MTISIGRKSDTNVPKSREPAFQALVCIKSAQRYEKFSNATKNASFPLLAHSIFITKDGGAAIHGTHSNL